MNKNNKQILVFALILIFSCFLAIIFFSLPSFIKQFDLSKTSTNNIGSTIGGITAPIIGILSAILLYLALTKQTQSNIDQRIKNECDIIFLLLNQFDKEISSFYFTIIRNKEEFKYTGIEAFHVFVQELNQNSILSNYPYTFNSFYQTKHILLTLRSFSLIKKRIEYSELSDSMKKMFFQKLNSVYECKIKESLIILNKAIEKNPRIKDFSTEEINSFLKNHN